MVRFDLLTKTVTNDLGHDLIQKLSKRTALKPGKINGSNYTKQVFVYAQIILD